MAQAVDGRIVQRDEGDVALNLVFGRHGISCMKAGNQGAHGTPHGFIRNKDYVRTVTATKTPDGETVVSLNVVPVVPPGFGPGVLRTV